MGKNKLRKFSELREMDFVFQYPFGRLAEEGFPMRGKWHTDYFKNENPIVLELGCGKGEYTVGLAAANPQKNYIGVDIKGARMWTGAKDALSRGMGNVAFLRTNIELIEKFFAPGEVAEIWITFPDPQMKKVRKRLTSATFLERYKRVMAPEGFVRLKTDSPFLYTYTKMLADHNELEIEGKSEDLHNDSSIEAENPLRTIRTHYEQQWLDRGLSIKYLAFRIPSGLIQEPPGAEEIERDTYKSYSRRSNKMADIIAKG